MICQERSIARLTFLVVASCLGGIASAAHAQVENSSAIATHRIRAADKQTIDVAIGLFLIDVARINGREETFDIEGYLDATWVDPALARSNRAPSRSPAADETRMPSFEFVNSIEQVKFKQDGIVRIDDSGRARRRIRFGGKFSSPLKGLRRFPFDKESLHIYITVFDARDDTFVLTLDQGRTGRSKYAFLSDWDIVEPTGGSIGPRPEVTGPENPLVLDYTITVARRSHYYFWRALLPMTLLVMASWLVFWFEPTNLQPQISTALSILLSLVTFTFSVDFSLPKVTYLTFIDRYALTSFVFVLSAIVMVAVIHVTLARRGVDNALLVQSWARRAFPAAYGIVVIGVVLNTLF